MLACIDILRKTSLTNFKRASHFVDYVGSLRSNIQVRFPQMFITKVSVVTIYQFLNIISQALWYSEQYIYLLWCNVNAVLQYCCQCLLLPRYRLNKDIENLIK